jgi:hypothetical protein
MLEMLVHDFFTDNDIQEHIQFNESFREYTYGEYLFDIDGMQIFEGIHQVVTRGGLRYIFDEKLLNSMKRINEFSTYFGNGE